MKPANPNITCQHTYTFPETGESVTYYVLNSKQDFAWGLSFSHKEKGIKWTRHYAGILRIQSKVNPKIWYIVLSPYWDNGEMGIPTERVMMVKDCNA